MSTTAIPIKKTYSRDALSVCVFQSGLSNSFTDLADLGLKLPLFGIQTETYDRPPKASNLASVAGRTTWDDHIDQCVSVAINPDIFHAHQVSALLSFFPKALTGAGIEVGISCLQRQFIRRSVCVSEHEDLVSVFVLNDNRD